MWLLLADTTWDNPQDKRLAGQSAAPVLSHPCPQNTCKGLCSRMVSTKLIDSKASSSKVVRIKSSNNSSCEEWKSLKMQMCR